MYVRELTQIDSIPRERLRKFATIMHDMYRAYHLVTRLLEGQNRSFDGGWVSVCGRTHWGARALISGGRGGF